MAEQNLDADGNVDTEKCYNTSVVYAPTGERLASYRKIHLFDVDIPGGMSIAESDRVVPGEGHAVVVDTEHGKFGLSICYDLRFPELYRSLQEKGANVLLILRLLHSTLVRRIGIYYCVQEPLSFNLGYCSGSNWYTRC